MTKPIARDSIYKGRRFQSETIELCVRWYITYRLSYRDLAAMMAEREIVVSHTTIMRWVLRYVPEYEKRWPRRYARKIFEGRGLYLLVMPNGSQYWRYNYRFGGKHKNACIGSSCRCSQPGEMMDLESAARSQVPQPSLAVV